LKPRTGTEAVQGFGTGLSIKLQDVDSSGKIAVKV
jgi:hypothetical protein